MQIVENHRVNTADERALVAHHVRLRSLDARVHLSREVPRVQNLQWSEASRLRRFGSLPFEDVKRTDSARRSRARRLRRIRHRRGMSGSAWPRTGIPRSVDSIPIVERATAKPVIGRKWRVARVISAAFALCVHYLAKGVCCRRSPEVHAEPVWLSVCVA